MVKRGFLDNRGAALVTTIWVVIIVFILGTAVLTLGGTERKIAFNQIHGVQALYLAEAGIQISMAELAQDPGWRFGFSNVQFGTGALEGVYVNDLGSTLKLTSTAKVKNTVRRIEAEVLLPFTCTVLGGVAKKDIGETLQLTGSTIIKGDLVFQGAININSSIIVEGNILAGGTVTNLGTVVGDVRAGGNIINQGKITGKREPFTQITLPDSLPVDIEYYRDHADFVLTGGTLGPEELSAGLPIKEGVRKGIVLIDGDLILQGHENEKDYEGQIVVAVNGDIELKCDLKPLEEGHHALALVAMGDINLGSHSIKAIIHGDRRVNLQGGKVFGSLLGRVMVLDGHVFFDETLTELLIELPVSWPQLITWKES